MRTEDIKLLLEHLSEDAGPQTQDVIMLDAAKLVDAFIYPRQDIVEEFFAGLES